MFRIEKDVTGESYQKLIQYCREKTDVVMIVFRKDPYITELIQYEYMENLLKENLHKMNVDEIWEKVRDQKEIFEDEIVRKEVGSKEERNLIVEFKKQRIHNIISSYQYNKEQCKILQRECQMIKQKLKESIIEIKHETHWYGSEVWMTNRPYHGDYALEQIFCKYTDQVYQYLLERNRLFYYESPYMGEDITWIKDGYCILRTVTHEQIAELYIQDRKERQLIEQMGIKLSKEYDGCYGDKDKLFYENIG